MSKTFTVEEVSQHNKAEDCWIIIEGKVYNVTKFLSSHPGGKKPILNLAGKDATKEFQAFHNVADVLNKYGPELFIGNIGAAKQQAPSSSASKELVPYGDPTWYQGWRSTYYTDSHKRFQVAVRAFVEKELMPFCHEWDEAKKIPKEVWGKAYEAGILPACIGPPYPTQYVPGSKLPGGIKPEEFDRWHEFILLDELARCGSGGVLWGLVEGLCIGLPPVLLFGSKYLQDKVATDCLTGKKMICLGVTEPAAGSDVANITTVAKKSPCGKFYIVNGEKKFITNGIWADYFTTAVRTGGPGGSGISFLLIERNMPGVSTRPMNMSGVWASGTTYITFEDVKVPVENLIGKENEGFKYIMHNFNHERWGLVVQTNRFARVCFEEAFKYAHKRKTFGQRLVDHPVIRQKLANMARQIEATHNWLENVTLQLDQMSHAEAMQKLSGPIGLLKAHSTFVFEYCAREAFQIFGGLAYTRGSQGEKVERLYRDVRAYAIGGGSEEILLDLGIRQAMKFAKL